MNLKELKKELENAKNAEQTENLQRFFKTGKGQYGEGDIFLGIKVPIQRAITKKYNLDLTEIQELLNSKIHEHRLSGLFALIKKYKKADSKEKKEIFEFYLKNAEKINNWDLVDLSAPNISGEYLTDKNKNILYEFTKSKNLWKRRIAVLSCFSFIKNKDFEDAIKISKLLLRDEEDLIHKAVGWMLREIGKREEKVLIDFLKIHSKEMPRTMLRYSIEKLDERRRKEYLKK